MLKTIYINPGDQVEIRVIQDPDIPKNAKEWNYQTRMNREHLMLTHVGFNRYEYVNPMNVFTQWQMK